VRSLTGGFDPSKSSIPNPANNLSEWKKIIHSEGFELGPYYGQRPNEQYLLEMLRTKGPVILYHYTKTLLNTPDPNSTHAVVITGIDTARDVCYVNNPWGAKDQLFPTDTILNSIEQLWALNQPALIYLVPIHKAAFLT
jgi:hypothetical protein